MDGSRGKTTLAGGLFAALTGKAATTTAPPCIISRLTQIPVKAGSGVTMVACGEDFSLAMSRSGNCYSTGAGVFGIHGLGTGDSTDSEELKDRWEFLSVGQSAAGFFASGEVRQLVVGEYHCAAVDSQGRLFLWGRNTAGECGVNPALQ